MAGHITPSGTPTAQPLAAIVKMHSWLTADSQNTQKQGVLAGEIAELEAKLKAATNGEKSAENQQQEQQANNKARKAVEGIRNVASMPKENGDDLQFIALLAMLLLIPLNAPSASPPIAPIAAIRI